MDGNCLPSPDLATIPAGCDCECPTSSWVVFHKTICPITTAILNQIREKGAVPLSWYNWHFSLLPKERDSVGWKNTAAEGFVSRLDAKIDHDHDQDNNIPKLLLHTISKIRQAQSGKNVSQIVNSAKKERKESKWCFVEHWVKKPVSETKMWTSLDAERWYRSTKDLIKVKVRVFFSSTPLSWPCLLHKYIFGCSLFKYHDK